MNGRVPPAGQDSDPARGEPVQQDIAEAIRKDFQALIDNLDRHIELLANTNSEALTHLARTKATAERGLRLSRQLAAIAPPHKPGS